MLTDIHLQAFYDPRVPAADYYCCKFPGDNPTYVDDSAYFGRFGCDLPYSMIDIAMQKMSTDHPDLDVILVPGDYVGHSISNEPPEWAEEGESPEFKTVQDKLSELKEVTTQVTDLFEKYFKDIPVLSTFGNNDTKYHY